MQKRSHSSVSLFFIEFIIALFFFLIVSTFCIRIFFMSHQMTRQAEELSHAQSIVSSTTELLWHHPGSLESVAAFYPSFEPDSARIFFSDNYECCEAAEASYQLQISETEQSEGSCISYTVTFSDTGGRMIYELTPVIHAVPTRQEVLS